MTDEATASGGAESAANAAAPVTERPQGIERLKSLVPHLRSEKKEPEVSTQAPEGKPAVEAKATESQDAPVESEAATTEAPAASSPPDIAAVAKMLGVSPDELVIDGDGSLAFKTKVDGSEGKAKLGDLRKSFQLESAHTRRLMELSEQKKAQETEIAQRSEAIKTKEQQLDQYLAVAQAELYRDFSAVDWASLKANDPVEFNTQYIAFQMRQQQVNAALEARSAEGKKAQEEATKREDARLEAEYRELLNHEPTWSEPETRKGFASFLKETYGLTDEGVAWIGKSTSRAIRIVLDAQRWHKHQAEAKRTQAEVLKKIDAAPKMAKASAPSSQDSEARKVAQLKTAIKKGDKTAGVEFLKRTVYAKR